MPGSSHNIMVPREHIFYGTTDSDKAYAEFQAGYNAGLSFDAAYSQQLRPGVFMSGSLGFNDMPYDLPGSGFMKPRICPENSLRRTTNPPAMMSQYPNIRLELVKGQKRLRQRGVTVAVGFQRSVGSKALPNWDRFPSVSDVLFNLNMELVDGDILASNARTMNCVLDWPGMSEVKWPLQSRTRRDMAIEIGQTFIRMIDDQKRDRIHGMQSLSRSSHLHLFNVQLQKLHLESLDYFEEWDVWCPRFSYNADSKV